MKEENNQTFEAPNREHCDFKNREKVKTANLKNKLKTERGSITAVVTVTIMFFVTILATAYAITATIRQSQLKSQLAVKEQYEKDINNANEIAQKLAYNGNKIDTSDATATAEDIVEGKTAYVNANKITGNATIAKLIGNKKNNAISSNTIGTGCSSISTTASATGTKGTIIVTLSQYCPNVDTGINSLNISGATLTNQNVINCGYVWDNCTTILVADYSATGNITASASLSYNSASQFSISILCIPD